MSCQHNMILDDICSICGETLPLQHHISQVSIPGKLLNLSITSELAKKIENNLVDYLSSSKKLALIIDIDHTILHTIPGISNTGINILINQKPLTIHLRPHIKHFLKHLNNLYLFYIYTMGTLDYARKIKHIIDPNSIYFHSGNIISRENHPEKEIKSLDNIFPFNKHMAIIIDDRDDVWPNTQNLIKVAPYNYKLPDNELLKISHLLTQIHYSYYTLGNSNILKIISSKTNNNIIKHSNLPSDPDSQNLLDLLDNAFS